MIQQLQQQLIYDKWVTLVKLQHKTTQSYLFTKVWMYACLQKQVTYVATLFNTTI